MGQNHCLCHRVQQMASVVVCWEWECDHLPLSEMDEWDLDQDEGKLHALSGDGYAGQVLFWKCHVGALVVMVPVR